MSKKKVKIKGTLSKQENDRIKKVLEKYGCKVDRKPLFNYGNKGNTFTSYIYE